jgi:hypothetical protein
MDQLDLVTPALPDPAVLIVMGLAGSGKSTVAALLAGRLGRVFEEGDGRAGVVFFFLWVVPRNHGRVTGRALGSGSTSARTLAPLSNGSWTGSVCG